MSDSVLGALAAALGIIDVYHDIRGRAHPTDDHCRRRIAAALGYPAWTEAAAASSLARLTAARWRRLTPAIQVVGRGCRPEVALRVPAAATGRVAWRLVAEDGTETAGEVPLDTLAVRAAAELDGRSMLARARALPATALPDGYHRLTVEVSGPDASASGSVGETVLAVTPPAARDLGDALGGRRRAWGVAAQLYGVRDAAAWGFGDFGTLARLGALVGRRGGDVVGINPVHALFPGDPGRFSPYAPSHRAFLDSRYIDVTRVPEFAETPAARDLVASDRHRAALAAAQAAALIDHAAVWALKRPVLEALFDAFRRRERVHPSARGGAFADFCAARGDGLRRMAVFDALVEARTEADPYDADWRRWPAGLRDPDGPEVAAFAADNTERVAFFQYLQWLADQQLADAAAATRAAGARLGLYGDLAVGTEPGGAEAWANQAAVATGLSLGAPPDPLGPEGQDWGLAPFAPIGLAEAGYAPFLAMLRAVMRHTGVVRIDHVMGLRQMFVYPRPETGPPEGADRPGRVGAYLRAPFEDLLGLVALESARSGAVVVGEDLGTVPDGFRPAVAAAGLRSYRVLVFEREADGRHRPPAAWPAQALATSTTHDLPTLAGWWRGRDLDWRRRLGQIADDAALVEAAAGRRADRAALVAAVRAAGLLAPAPAGTGIDPVVDAADLPETVLVAVWHFLAATPCDLAILPLEDIVGAVEQPNLPGTIDQHPNWRRRLAPPLDALAEDDRLATLARTMHAAGRTDA